MTLGRVVFVSVAAPLFWGFIALNAPLCHTKHMTTSRGERGTFSSKGGRFKPHSFVPRGGAREVRPPNISSKSPARVDEEVRPALSELLGLDVHKIFDRDRFPWLIALALSLIYLWKFVTFDPKSFNFQEGFCVTGLKVRGENMCPPPPDMPPNGCCPNLNSHELAWYVDIVFTGLALAIPHLSPSAGDLSLGIKLGIPLIIIGHGTLHKWFSSTKCMPPTDLGGDLYLAFVLALVALNILGFSNIPTPKNIVWIGILTALINFLTKEAAQNGNKAISSFFMSSQLLVSFTATFRPNDLVTPLMGWTFILSVIVSIIELTQCKWFETVGGHMWYDVFLHLSIITALFRGEQDKSKGQ